MLFPTIRLFSFFPRVHDGEATTATTGDSPFTIESLVRIPKSREEAECEHSKFASAGMDNDESFAEMSFETEQQDETKKGTVEQAISNQTEADTSSNGTGALTNQLI